MVVETQDKPMAEVTVAFHSDCGHIAKLAERIAAGASEITGVGSLVRSIGELTDDLWDDLERSDAIIFGSPTYMAGPSAVFKQFAEASLPIWASRGWTGKLAAAFTHSQAMSGDKLNTLQYFSLLAAQHGMVWVNLDLLPGWCREQASIDDLNRLGGWLGVMSQSNGDGPLETNPRTSDLETGRHLGRQVGEIAVALASGRAARAASGLAAPHPRPPGRLGPNRRVP